MSTDAITTEQRAAMVELFNLAKGADQELAPYEIIHRIAAIRKMTVERACTGYKTMRSAGIIPDKFVKGGKELEAKILKTFYTPIMLDLLERFGAVIANVRPISSDASGLKVLKTREERQLPLINEVGPELIHNQATDTTSLNIASNFARDLKHVEQVKSAIVSKLLGLDANF